MTRRKLQPTEAAGEQSLTFSGLQVSVDETKSEAVAEAAVEEDFRTSTHSPPVYAEKEPAQSLSTTFTILEGANESLNKQVETAEGWKMRAERAEQQLQALRIQHSTQSSPWTSHLPPTNCSMIKDDTHVIHADLLIPGKGEPMKDYAIVCKSGKITHLGLSSKLPEKYQSSSSTSVPVLMPGLWDCHTHLMGITDTKFRHIVTSSPATNGARLARSVHDILMSGFTSVRELGGYAPEIAKVIEEGIIPGPNIYSAGSAISQTAGHGDVFDMPIGWVWSRIGVGSYGAGNGNGDDVGCRPLCIADGVDECRKAVRLMIRRGAKVIKVLASGGVLSRDDDPKFQQFSDEELKVMVEEAARMDRIVAAHVHGKAGIMAALRAGCKTLEHGTYLDDEAIEIMKEKEVMLVATRTVVIEGVKHPEMMDPESYAKMLVTAKYHKQAYALAIKRGVKIALGTDLGTSAPGTGLSHGAGGGEISHAVDAGMTPLQAIEAATANGPATLGPQAPLSGQIKEGYDADLIALKRNPLDDIEMFKNVANITHVWKGGKAFKSPGKSS